MELVKASGDTRVRLAIEGKRLPGDPRSSAEFARGIVDAAVWNGMVDRIVLTSRDWTMIKSVNDGQVTPRVALSPIVGHFSRAYLGGADPAAFGGVMGMAQAYGASAVTIDRTMLSEALVADAHARGLALWAWTMNTPGEIADAVAAGADAVITNYPLAARALLAEAIKCWRWV